tara:strand:- start:4818 stop:5570 length:753 start_codon:yes stop_codon:yes gene_type:complete
MTDLKPVMELVKVLHEKHGVPQKGGKKYTQVVHRTEAFRKALGTDFGINTELLTDDGVRVVIKATITDKEGRIIGSGHAEEIRGEGHFNKGDKRNINTTSAIENAETSAIGRCLSSLGISGGEYASANELDAVQRKGSIIKVNNNVPEPYPTPIQTPNQRLNQLQDKKKEDAQLLEIRQARFQDLSNQIEKITQLADLTQFYKDRKETLNNDSVLCKMVIDKCSKRKQEIQKKDQFIHDLNNGQRENYLG